MTKQEKLLFEKLTADREENARILEKRAMLGVKTSVVDKYTDQAHFIYELLQNADDAGATSVRFVLDKNGLSFAHNGTRRFTVTDVDKETEDSENGSLGDINSITSIANSNKSDNKNTIGKFGVGFKAVFQYTETPLIYDPDIAFRIERFIVPKPIEDDNKSRRADETLFLFPFNHSKKSAAESYEDISSKLRSLSYPILFLSCIRDISFEFENIIGLYGKAVKETRYFEDITAEYICLTRNNGENIFDEYMWMFTRKDENGNKYSVGYAVNDNGRIVPKEDGTAFCFFPTKQVTWLKFIVHAPFLLNDSREGILAGEEHNRTMITLLAKLAGDSLVCLKDIAVEKNIRIIDDNILDIVPIDKSVFTEVGDRERISFRPFFTEIKKRFASEEIIPASDGYVSSRNAYWPYYTVLTEIFSNEQLAEIVKNPKARWVFASLPRHTLQRSRDAKNDYVYDMVRIGIDEVNILKKPWFGDDTGIESEFIEHQSIEWLHKFYAWLSETSARCELSASLPIFLNQDKKAVYAFDENEMPVLFLPVGTSKGFNCVYSELMSEPETVKFFKKIGLTEPSLRDEIYNHILPKYKVGVDIDEADDFKKIFGYYKQCPQSEINSFINLVKGCAFLVGTSSGSANPYRAKADELYFPTAELKKYFEPKPSTKFINEEFYNKLIDKSDSDMLQEFFIKLGVSLNVRIISYRFDKYDAYENNLPKPKSSNTPRWIEKRIDGCTEILNELNKGVNIQLSILLWNQLLIIC